MENKPSFLETPNFPIDDVNLASAKEKGGSRPPFWEMVFWWTRKPLASARAVIAGALLPESISVNDFKRYLQLNAKVPHRYNPRIPENWRKYFEGKKLLDPFAGFGNIPLEALRLGLSKVVAVEFLPSAYIFLKAVLEYPLKYGGKLVKDVEKWGNWVTEQLKKDPIIKQLYDEDVAVYIGTWEVKCPHCHKWTPLIGNWWLARVGEGEGETETYKRLAWMNYTLERDRVKITIVDLNEELQLRRIKAKVSTKEGKVSVGKKVFTVPKPNINAKRETAICLHCGLPIRYIDIQTGRHYTEIKKLPKDVKKRCKWYVKYALEKYHDGDDTYAKQKLLVKVKIERKNLKFESCTNKDKEKLELAKREIGKLLREKNPNIPTEPVPLYENRRITPILGIAKWYKFFNPRQLLTLVKLVKLIRESGKKVELEKLKEGLNEEEVFRYAEAVTTYLAMALVNHVRHNSIVTSVEPTRKFVAHVLAFRGIAMTWNWVDENPIVDFIGSWIRSIRFTINGLSYLVSAVRGSSISLFSVVEESYSTRVESIQDDATVLSKINFDEKFDLIVTDPPYYDDVPYTELSDFYYVWLKRALSDVRDNKLVPRFHKDAFFKKVGEKWVEIRTQWQEFAKREVGLNPPRLGPNTTMEMGKKHFLDLLKRSFEVMSDRLVDTGVLVTYYAHTNPEAWEALLEAGWRAGGFRITTAFPLITESPQRVTARGKVALDTSIIVVWRKGVFGIASAEELYREAIERASERALELIKSGRRGADLFIGTMSAILNIYTCYEEVISQRGRLTMEALVKEFVYPATALAIARALGKLAGRVLGVSGEVGSASALFYLLAKALFLRSPRARRRILDRSSLIMLTIGTRSDEKFLRDAGVILRRDNKFYLMEPRSVELRELEVFLRDRGLFLIKPALRSSIDALHILEYYASSLPRRAFNERLEKLKASYPSYIEEALAMAKILNVILPKVDPEKSLCERLIASLPGGLERFLPRSEVS